MRNRFMIIGLLALSISCAKGPTSNKVVESDKVDVSAPASLSSSQKTDHNATSEEPLQVKGMVAVFFSPDSKEIEQLKIKVGEDNFDKIVEDNNYYNSEAIKELEKSGIKVILTRDRYIEFLKEDGQKVKIDKTTLEEKWGLILFDGKKEPLSVSPIDIAPEIKNYFNK